MHADRVMLRARLADESGSMLVALLATIVAAGLMVVITSYAFSGHRSARFDRNRNVVIQTADAGINEALFRLQTNVALPTAASPATETLAGGSVRWWGEPWPNASSPDRKVTSEGTFNGVKRKVQAVLTWPKPFTYGVFADNRITLNGGNSVNSYSATTWGTGVGEIGANGTVRLNGNVTADGIDLHNWDVSSTDRCIENGNNLCTTRSETFGPARDLASPDALAFIAAGLNSCTTNLGVWTGTALSGGVYCAERIEIAANANVAINGTATNPVIIYLTGPPSPTAHTVSIGSSARVGCPTLSGTPALCSPRPEASRLQIFTASALDVRIGSHSHFGGTIYAPRASCRGNPSNAQAHIYGAMICRTVTNQGGWSFHYDQRLGDVGVGNARVTHWSEG